MTIRKAIKGPCKGGFWEDLRRNTDGTVKGLLELSTSRRILLLIGRGGEELHIPTGYNTEQKEPIAGLRFGEEA